MHVTPLHEAAMFGHFKVCEYLIKSGADAEAKTKDGFTPLHRAARAGHKDVCQLLLSKGVTVNNINLYNMTSLDYVEEGLKRLKENPLKS